MITVKHLLEQYDLLLKNDDVTSRRLFTLAEQGLLDEKKVPMLKRSLEKSPEHMTMAEKKSLLETVDSLISVVDSEQLNEAKQNYMSKFDKRVPQGYPKESDIPTVVILQRKAIRVFPDNQKIALYYSQALDKYVSIPFGPADRSMGIHMSEETLNEVSQEKATDVYARGMAAVEKIKNDKTLTPAQKAMQARAMNDRLKKLSQRMRTNVSDKTGKNIRTWAGDAAVKTARDAGKLQIDKERQGKEDAAKAAERKKSLSANARLTDLIAVHTGKFAGDAVRNMRAAPVKESFKEKVAAKRQQRLDEVLPLAIPLLGMAAKAALGVAGRAIASGAAKTVAKTAGRAALGAGRLAGRAGRGARRLARRVGGKALDALANMGNSGQSGNSEDPFKPTGSNHEFGLPIQINKPDESIFTQAKKANIAYGQGSAPSAGAAMYNRIQEQTNFDKLSMLSESTNSVSDLFFDDKSVSVNSRVAKKIMNLHESLNRKNKTKIEDMINEDILSFRKVINFALRQ